MGRRGPDPPLPDQGARRAAVDLPAVLRALHPHGPGRQLHPAGRQAQARSASRSTGSTRCSTYLRRTPGCATWWSPAATWPTCRGRGWRPSSTQLLEIDTIRDIRLATKALMGLPQHWLQRRGARRDGAPGPDRPRPRRRRWRSTPTSTTRSSVTPLVAQAAQAMLEAGVRDVRNQGVLLRGVNDTAAGLLDLCFALLDGASVTAVLLLPVRHDPRRRALAGLAGRGAAAAARDHGLPARASRPRGSSATCPTSASAGCTRSPTYDTVRGISYWTKNYRTAIEADDADALTRRYPLLRPDPHPARRGSGLVGRPELSAQSASTIGRSSKAVDSTTVVTVDTCAALRIRPSSSSR